MDNNQPSFEEELDFVHLSKEDKQLFYQFVGQIDLSNEKEILAYAISLEEKVKDFFQTISKKWDVFQGQGVADKIKQLASEVEKYKIQEDGKGFVRRFILGESTQGQIERMILGFAKSDAFFEKEIHLLERIRMGFIHDISVLDSLYQYNLQYYKELSLYILAGEQKRSADVDPNVTEEHKHIFRQRIEQLRRLQTRCIQLAPKIWLVQRNKVLLIEKMSDCIRIGIPSWRSHMVSILSQYDVKKEMPEFQENGIRQLKETNEKMLDLLNEMDDIHIKMQQSAEGIVS